MARLEAEKTPVTFLELAQALERVWEQRFGEKPTRESLCVLLAHSALETGHWKHAYCYNLGNAKATDAWSGDHCFYPADEIVPGAHVALASNFKAPRTDGVPGHNLIVRPLSSGQAHVTLYPDHPWCRFRAFRSLDEGASDYLMLLHGRFSGAWPAVQQGDPELFVRTLKELHYFTASLERYLPPVLSLFKKFNEALTQPAAADPSVSAERAVPVPVGNRPTLRPLVPDPHVLELQRTLLSLGYTDNGMVESGLFDEATKQSVELFQLQHVDQRGLPLTADGIVGKNTWWALLNPSGDAQRSNVPPSSVEGLTTTRQKLLELLYAEHAKPVFEVPDGSNRSKDIDGYWGNTGLRGQPWCCAFVSWALFQALGRYPITRHHTGVQVMWLDAKRLGQEVQDPKPGDVFIQIKSGGKGHTGFVAGVSRDGNTIYTCEGNCGNRLKLGQRPRSSIHHFIDPIADSQPLDFKRGVDLDFELVGEDDTR